MKGHTSAETLDPHKITDIRIENDCLNTGMSITCNGKVEGVPVEMLVDTGSVFTLISKDLWDKICKELPTRGKIRCAAGGSTTGLGHLELVKEQQKVVSANGDPLEIMGRVNLTLSVGQEEAKQSVWVATDLAQDCILGVDFMRPHRMIVDFDEMILKTKKTKLELKLGTENISCRIASAKTDLIPAGHEKIIQGKLVIKGRGDIKSRRFTGMVESRLRPTDEKPLLLARSLVTTSDQMIPIRIANFSDRDITVYKNTNLGIFSSLNDFESQEEDIGVCASAACKSKEVNIDDIHVDASLSEREQKRLAALLKEYSDIFSQGPGDLGRTSMIQHNVDTGESVPIRQGVRRVPLHKQKEIKEHIDAMLNQGIIQPSCSPWAAPVVLVPKKDGSTRFCIDYRKVNAVTKKDAYPLPRIDQTLDALEGAKLFSSLDLVSGYWQIELDSSSKEKSAFTTNWGLYEFNVMPFGLCGAPSTFQRLMETVLAGLQWDLCLVYLDDIIIFSHTFDEHLERLGKVFQRIRNAKLKLKPSKCHLFQSRINCLGHIISEKGIEPDESKIKDIKEWKTPTSALEVQNFLGFASYYRRFVAGFSQIASPLYRLTQKNLAFVWDEKCHEAFLELKRRLTAAPILSFPRSDCPFIIDTDASDYGIGAVLSQIQDGRETVIAYASRTLSKSERNYCTTRKELLALVYFIKQFRHYLYGVKFIARTDHKALKWLFNIKEPEGQIARWITQLSEYEFDIEHREGKKHGNADGLSRLPCLQGDSDKGVEERALCMVSNQVPNQRNLRRCTVDKSIGSGTACGSSRTLDEQGTISGDNGLDLIKNRQMCDEDLQHVLSWDIGGKRPDLREVEGRGVVVKDLWSKFDQLVIYNRNLYMKWEAEKKSTFKLKLIVPASMVNDILTSLHSSSVGGHLGVAKTYGKTADRFYWYGMKTDVAEFIARCEKCVARKNPVPLARAPLQPHRAGYPFEKVAMDILEVPLSERGNRYILVVSDYFSKWVEAFALKSHTAPVVAEILVDQIISRCGAPNQLHSDQGPEFESKLISEMCRILNIDKTRTTGYHPQSDGQVERFNRTLLAMLSKYVQDNQKDWDVHLQKVMMGYRTSEHESTKYTPAFVLFRRELILPLDVQYHLPDNSHADSCSDFVNKMKTGFVDAYKVVRDNLSQAQKTMKDYYDRKTQGAAFSEGDQVWYFDPKVKKGRSTKLNRPWKGPFTVKKRISDLVYRIQLNGSKIRKVVHFNKLKKLSANFGNTPVDKSAGRNKVTKQEVDYVDEDEEDDNDVQLRRGRADLDEPPQLLFPPTPPDTPIGGRRFEAADDDDEEEDEDAPDGQNQQRDDSEEEWEDARDGTDMNNVDMNNVVSDHVHDIENSGLPIVEDLRRSTRARRNPKYLEDFILEVENSEL